jgi:mRNA interferase MazF
MNRGDIWLVNLDPTVGSEIRKTRPCVIVSDDAIGALPLKVIAPLTDLKERYRSVPWMVCLEPDAVNGLLKPSALDLFQVRCVAEERLVRKLGGISSAQILMAHHAIRVVFGMSGE